MSNYTANNFQQNDMNTSWQLVFGLIEPNSKVLDVGCSSGTFGEELIEKKQCTVDGIEIDDEDVRLARKKLRQVEKLDVDVDEPADLFKETYDYVLFIDVIEHLKNPVVVLNKVKQMLSKNGKVLFSIPNMSHTSIRLALLNGDFTYTETGLLDKTHLHFYNASEIERVFKGAGYSIDTWNGTSYTYAEELLKTKLDKLGLRYTKKFSETLTKTGANIYQHVGLATPINQDASDDYKVKAPKINQHEKDFKEVTAAYKEYREYIKHLELSVTLKENHIKNLEQRISELERKPLDKLSDAVRRRIRG